MKTGWLMKTIISAVILSLVGGAFAWAASQSSKTSNHETRLSVVEEHQKNADKTLDEIKAGNVRIEDKLDRALRRRQ